MCLNDRKKESMTRTEWARREKGYGDEWEGSEVVMSEKEVKELGNVKS